MKNKMTYFNYEERNGIFLLTFILILFTTFIFLQKRVLPSQTNLVINHEETPILALASFGGSSYSKDDNTVETDSKNDKPRLDGKYDNKEVTFSKEKEKVKISSKSRSNYDYGHKSSAKLVEKKDYSTNYTPYKKKVYKKKKVVSFSINSQDVEDWESLYGIGPTYAERIVKYQKWLGGFHSVGQLSEVYGVTDSLVNEISKYLILDKPYRLIKLNQAELKELGKHPYLDWKQAKKILKFKKHHGDYGSIEDLRKVKGLDSEQIERMLPYLDFSISIIEQNIELDTSTISKE